MRLLGLSDASTVPVSYLSRKAAAAAAEADGNPRQLAVTKTHLVVLYDTALRLLVQQ